MSEPNVSSHRPTPSRQAPQPAERPSGGRPSAIDDFRRGQLLIALACGLTQREAAAWIGASQSNVSYLVRNGEFSGQLREHTEFARLHPLLRMHQAAGQSWRAAACLLNTLEARQGPLTTDEIVASMSLMLEQVNAASCAPE